MTPKEILDSFSETLMQDERIVSPQERSLLAALLHHANIPSGRTAETQQAVRAVIAAALGETVAQRAFAVLGGNIVERIVQNSAESSTISTRQNAQIHAGNHEQPSWGMRSSSVKSPHTLVAGPGDPSPNNPSTPSPDPGGPKATPPPVHQPKHAPMRDPGPSPTVDPGGPRATPPPTGAPQPPAKAPLVDPGGPRGSVDTAVVSQTTTLVEERPTLLPVRCVVLDEFLAPQELEQITAYALAHEADFRTSEVVSRQAEGGVVNFEHRRSRVLMELGAHQDLILKRIESVLPQVLERLGMEPFSVATVEAQMTASNDGDYFHFHSDNSSEPVSSRYLTFVYFFHREPVQFEGGDLRIHDARLEEGTYVSQGSYQTIVPRQNQIVFFPCELVHEITPVKCSSGLFADSRFTLNGWLRR
jgi:SM-20-related protein